MDAPQSAETGEQHGWRSGRLVHSKLWLLFLRKLGQVYSHLAGPDQHYWQLSGDYSKCAAAALCNDQLVPDNWLLLFACVLFACALQVSALGARALVSS
jgi:hypothetical protein